MDRNRPLILFASGTKKLSRFGVTPADMYEWMRERGYGVYFLEDFLTGAPPMALERYLAAHDYPYQAFNFFAKHADDVSRQT